MKARILPSAGLCAALVAAFPVIASAATPSTDEQSIRALQARLAAAVAAGNLDAVMAEYVPGDELFVFDSDLPRQHRGWESYKKDWWGFLGSAKDIKVEIRGLGVTVAGAAAFSHDLEHLSWTKRSDGSHGEMLLSVTDGYRKIGGKWVITLEHWSIPVADGKAQYMAKP